jgi:putative FmdB family regulatory protein
MPIYEFECSDCRKHFDSRRTVSEMELGAMCPFCGSSRTKREFPKSFSYLRNANVNRRHMDTSPLDKHDDIDQIGYETMGDYGALMSNVFIEDCGGGIKAVNTKIVGKNVKIKGCGVGIDADNSDIAIEGLKIK